MNWHFFCLHIVDVFVAFPWSGLPTVTVYCFLHSLSFTTHKASFVYGFYSLVIHKLGLIVNTVYSFIHYFPFWFASEKACVCSLQKGSRAESSTLDSFAFVCHVSK